MASLKAPPQGWEDAILIGARQFMNANVCFYREVTTGPAYDVITNTGGDNGIHLYWRGKARVQHLRTPREFEGTAQPSATRFFRFQLDPAEPGNSLPRLPAGVKARVIAGGRDSDLESLVFVTSSAINSSHMAVRTVELSSNMKFLDWQWDPDDEPSGLYPSDGLYPSYFLYPLAVS